MVIDPSQPIDYSSRKTPSSYVCGGKKCKNKRKPGLKLWRDYGNSNPNKQTLRCADCSAEQAGVDISTMDEAGRYQSEAHAYTNLIGSSRVPAVPTKENDDFWSSFSTPNNAAAWWANLPLR